MLGTARMRAPGDASAPPSPAPRWMERARSLSQVANARVEVVDAESGAFIPGAEVSVVWAGGQVTKTSDAGGNVSFSGADFTRAGMPGRISSSDLSIEAGKSGYQTRRVPFRAGEVVSVALDLSPWYKRVPVWGWVAGAIGLGLVVTALLKRR